MLSQKELLTTGVHPACQWELWLEVEEEEGQRLYLYEVILQPTVLATGQEGEPGKAHYAGYHMLISETPLPWASTAFHEFFTRLREWSWRELQEVGFLGAAGDPWCNAAPPHSLFGPLEEEVPPLERLFLFWQERLWYDRGSDDPLHLLLPWLPEVEARGLFSPQKLTRLIPTGSFPRPPASGLLDNCLLLPGGGILLPVSDDDGVSWGGGARAHLPFLLREEEAERYRRLMGYLSGEDEELWRRLSPVFPWHSGVSPQDPLPFLKELSHTYGSHIAGWCSGAIDLLPEAIPALDVLKVALPLTAPQANDPSFIRWFQLLLQEKLALPKPPPMASLTANSESLLRPLLTLLEELPWEAFTRQEWVFLLLRLLPEAEGRALRKVLRREKSIEVPEASVCPSVFPRGQECLLQEVAHRYLPLDDFCHFLLTQATARLTPALLLFMVEEPLFLSLPLSWAEPLALASKDAALGILSLLQKDD